MNKHTPQDLGRHAMDVAGDMSHRVAQAAHSGLDTLRDRATRAGDQAVDCVRDAPVKSVVTAVAVGAIAVLLWDWLARSRRY